jgi:hypothetical protein
MVKKSENKESTLDVLRDDAREANDVMLIRQLDQIEKEIDLQKAEVLARGIFIGVGASVVGIGLYRLVASRFTTTEAE